MNAPAPSDDIHAADILTEVAIGWGVPVPKLSGRRQAPIIRAARAEAAFRLWTETTFSLSMIAAELGRKDHGTAIALVLSGAHRRGVRVARVSQLRGNGDGLDWTRLSLAVAGWRRTHGVDRAQVATLTGLSISAVRAAEMGRSLDPATLIKLSALIDFDPRRLAVSRETAVKPERAAA